MNADLGPGNPPGSGGELQKGPQLLCRTADQQHYPFRGWFAQYGANIPSLRVKGGDQGRMKGEARSVQRKTVLGPDTIFP